MKNYINGSFKIFSECDLFSPCKLKLPDADCYHLLPVVLPASSTLPPCNSLCWELSNGFPSQRKHLSLEKKMFKTWFELSYPTPLIPLTSPLSLCTLCALFQVNWLHCFFLSSTVYCCLRSFACAASAWNGLP